MIYLTGDTHANFKKLSEDNFAEGYSLTKDDFVIILGDFGGVWDNLPTEREANVIKWLDDRPWTTLFIDGNHENFFRLDRLDTVEKFGSKVGVVSDSVYHLKRGEVYCIDGFNIFTFGGGFSIDKESRVEWISWWDREMPNHDEYSYGLSNLSKHDFKVDYILTHTTSSSMFKLYGLRYFTIKTGENSLMKYLEIVKEKTDFRRWYFGHFHENDIFTDTKGREHICLMDKKVELGKSFETIV